MIYFNYITTNKINGKRYVGAHSTNNINDGYLGGGKIIGQAIKKYGKENFTRDVLNRTLTSKEAFHNEKFLIEMYNTLVPNGYNLSPTGGTNIPGCSFHSKETKKLMSESTIGNTNVRGRKFIYNKELNIEKRVKEEDLTYYLDNGYELKRRPFTSEHIENITSNIGYLWIYNKKLNKEKQIKKEEISQYLNNGYELRRRPFSEEHIKKFKGNTPVKGRRRIHNKELNKEKFVKEKELKQYFEKGWELGCSKESIEKSRQSNIGKHSGKNHPMYGITRRWINKNEKNKYVKEEELQHYLNNSWELGIAEETKKKNKKANLGEKNGMYGKFWIHNKKLKQNKVIKKEEKQKYLDSGWKLGRKIKIGECK